MTTEIAKKCFDFCAQAYEDQPGRKAFGLPEWIVNLRTDRESAKTAHVCLQAAVISMLQTPGANGYMAGMSFDEEMTPAGYVAGLAAVLQMNAENQHDPLGLALFSLGEHLRFEGHMGKLPNWHAGVAEPNPLHALATEAANRDASAVTPVDVVQFMFDLAASERVHAYALDGLGLLYGTKDGSTVCPVGQEIGTGRDYELPSLLSNIYEESRLIFRAPEFANRTFLELEQLTRCQVPSADALLVNASRCATPFYPPADEEGPVDSEAGVLNHCLNAGYSRVVVLVSNHSLTAGRGRAAKILQHCLQNGLRQVIQLPMGVLGVRSQAHSILVFEKTANIGEVEFLTLSDQFNTSNPIKGFGQPRRARGLLAGAEVPPGQRYIESVENLLERNNGKGSVRARKLLSFEAGQFAKKDVFDALRGRYQFMRLGSFMDVFRSHHILESGDKDRSIYNEIGAVNITPEGSILIGRVKDCPSESLQQRRAQVLLDEDLIVCFRGSPDSFGKVGIYRHKKGVIAIPNQSFVIIRRKKNAPDNAPNATHVLWWLKSAYAQRYLQMKAIAPDVMRITPKDIDAIEVPCGPAELIQAEKQRLIRAEQAIQKMSELREEVATLLRLSWQ